jgi:hypothetical protein
VLRRLRLHAAGACHRKMLPQSSTMISQIKFYHLILLLLLLLLGLGGEWRKWGERDTLEVEWERDCCGRKKGMHGRGKELMHGNAAHTSCFSFCS